MPLRGCDYVRNLGHNPDSKEIFASGCFEQPPKMWIRWNGGGEVACQSEVILMGEGIERRYTCGDKVLYGPFTDLYIYSKAGERYRIYQSAERQKDECFSMAADYLNVKTYYMTGSVEGQNIPVRARVVFETKWRVERVDF